MLWRGDVMNEAAVRPSAHVLYVNWDGFAFEWYRMVNERYGGTPHLNALIRDGVLFTRAETGVPAITGAMQQCIASGAWPADTGNCYRYYDAASNRVRQYGRDNRLENIAEAAVRHGIRTAAVHAWYFQQRGTWEGDETNPYFHEEWPSSFSRRTDLLLRIIRGQPVVSGGRKIVFRQMPRFLAIYGDDLDGAAHNGNVGYLGLKRADTRRQWLDNIAATLMRLDDDLGRIMQALKETGMDRRTTIVLTTDHGMVPYGAGDRDLSGGVPAEARTSLHDLAETVAEAGVAVRGERFRVECLFRDGESAREETDIVVTPVVLQAQIRFRRPLPDAAVQEIVARLRSKPYYGAHLTNDELVMRGTADDYADLLVSARPPHHFRPDSPDDVRLVGGNHDSLDGGVRHIFSLLYGAHVRKGIRIDRKVTIADVAPTIARLLGFEGPAGAVGTALDEALEEPLRGPALEVAPVPDRGGADLPPNGDGEPEGGAGAESAGQPAEMRGYVTVGEKADAVTLAGISAPCAHVSVNAGPRVSAGADGRFAIRHPLAPGMNRLVVEAEAGGRKTRRTLFVKRLTNGSSVTSS